MENEKTMETIRAIRDANSLRRIKMSQAERDTEDKLAREWFEKQINRPLKTLNVIHAQ